MVITEKKVNLFLILSLVLYIELQIIPQFFFALDSLQYVTRDGFILLVFAITIFSFLFLKEENVTVREKQNYGIIGVHIALTGLFYWFLVYLSQVDYKQPVNPNNTLLILASYFRENVKYLTVIYRIEFLAIGFLCHLALILAFFKIRLWYLWYIVSFPIAILANEISAAVLCPFLFYNFWIAKNLHTKRISALSFGLALSTIFNKQLWTLLSYSVAKINVFLLGLFFNPIVEQYTDGGHNPIIGTSEFHVYIADKCSGMEGLTTFFVAFLAVFIPIMNKMYKGNVFVFGIFGLIVMYMANTMRIFVLILLGHFLDSQFIVDLWHSYGSMVLYSIVIYWLLTYAYKWCKIPEEELLKLHKEQEFREESFLEKTERLIPAILRFPVDMILLFFHTFWINLTKTSIYSWLRKQNCQYVENQITENGQEKATLYCRASAWYASPQVAKCVCPLVDITYRSQFGRAGCKAATKPKIYFFRALFIVLVYTTTILLTTYVLWQYVQHGKNIDTRAIREDKQNNALEEAQKLFDDQKYLEAEEKTLHVLQMNIRFAQAHLLLAKVYEKQLETGLKKIDITNIFQEYSYVIALDPEIVDAQLQVAYMYVFSSATEKAMEIANNLIAQEKNLTECLAILALCELSKGNTVEARNHLNALVAQNKKVPLFHYLQGLFFVQEAKWKEAKEKFYEVNETYYINMQAKLKIVSICMYLKQYDETEKILLEIQSKSNSVDTELSLAKLYFLQKKTALALKQVEIIKPQIEEKIPYIENVVMLLIDNYQNEMALTLAIENIDAFPESIALHFAIAKVYADSGLFGEALEHCQYILQKSANVQARVTVFRLLGNIYSTQGKEKEAKNAYKNVVDLVPNSMFDRCLLANALQQEKKYEEALKEYDKASTIDSDDYLPFIGKAQVYILQKQWSKVVENLKIAQQKDAMPSLIFTMRGELYQETGKMDEAEKMYRKVIEESPKQCADAATKLAKLLASKDKLIEALQFAGMAIRLAKTPERMYVLAEIYYKMEKWRESLAITEELLLTYFDNGKYLYYNGLALAKLQYKDKAIQVLQKAKRLLDDDEMMQQCDKVINFLQNNK